MPIDPSEDPKILNLIDVVCLIRIELLELAATSNFAVAVCPIERPCDALDLSTGKSITIALSDEIDRLWFISAIVQFLRWASYAAVYWVVIWCQGEELNQRPAVYDSAALPLSYPGENPPSTSGSGRAMGFLTLGFDDGKARFCERAA
jgi:hypothetical protein